MALTELQRKRLIEGINSININQVLNFFQSEDLKFEDVPNISDERKAYIIEQMDKIPNPTEQKEWAAISNMLDQPSKDLQDKLTAYVRKWEGIRPAENHVDEARIQYESIDKALREIEEAKERQEWETVDAFNINSLITYLQKYPHSTHLSEIDDTIWGMSDKESVNDIKRYQIILPQGSHNQEAAALLNSIVEWNKVKATNEIFTISDYVQNHTNTPFKNQASILIQSLKENEMRLMQDEPNSYSPQRLSDLINKGIITKEELICKGVMTENVLETLRATNIQQDLPDIKAAIEGSTPVCKQGFTDVFFFGVPSTGKTCILMGMSRSASLNVNLASGGGDYAAALQQYTDVGMTVPRTPGTFVTTLEAKISSNTNKNSDHFINLVEMSGEEFAFQIANNPDHNFNFEDMGSGATKLLQNDNRKVFFLIIDPTANVVRINREVPNEDPVTGEMTTSIQYCVVNQRTLIQKMVNLLQNDENSNILKKVDSIHIIMTKSDTLGDAVEREDRANKIFREKFGGDILEPLIDLCKEYNINAATNFHPKLYTFSLGKFYVGGLYEYEQNDSNRLVKAIKNATQATKKKSWWNRIQEVVNK